MPPEAPPPEAPVRVAEAVQTIRSVGSLELAAGRIRYRIPRQHSPVVAEALTVLKECKQEATALLAPGGRAKPTAAPRKHSGYPTVPPEGCPRCGGWTFRLEAGLAVCDLCAPEGAEIVRDEDVRWVQQSAAVDLLHEAGVRIMESPAGPERFVLGVWRDLDSPELREAFRLLRLERLPLRYLDDPSVPEKYRDYRPQPRQPRLFP